MKQLQRIVLALITIGTIAALSAPLTHADSLVFGQTQSYDVTLRSDKKAVTNAKIMFTNDEKDDQKEFTFTVPSNVKVSAMSIYQVLPPKEISADCKEKPSEPFISWLNRTKAQGTQSQLQQQYAQEQKCPTIEKYQENYDFSSYVSSSQYNDASYNGFSSRGSVALSKLVPATKDTTYTVTLTQPVKSQQKAALLVSYIGDGFITEFAGNYTYNYKTLIVKDTVRTVSTQLTLDDDLYAKGTKAKTTPQSTESATTSSDNNGLSSGASTAQGKASSYYGETNTIYRTGKNLLPGDTLAISGSFSDSIWKLYIKEIVAVLLIAGIAVLGWLLWRKKHHGHIIKKPHVNKDIPTATHTNTRIESPSQPSMFNDKPLNIKIAITAAVLGVAAAIAIVVLMAAITQMTAQNTPGYAYDEGAQIRGYIAVLAILYVAVIAPLFITMKHGQSTMFAWITIELVLIAVTLTVTSSTMPL